MARLGPRHLDSRRKLLPVSYLERPADFGRRQRPAFVLPQDGDIVSQRIAVLQHQLIFTWNERGRRPSVGELCREWRVSKQTLSRCTLGERWLGETLLAAFVQIVARPSTGGGCREPQLTGAYLPTPPATHPPCSSAGNTNPKASKEGTRRLVPRPQPLVSLYPPQRHDSERGLHRAPNPP